MQKRLLTIALTAVILFSLFSLSLPTGGEALHFSVVNYTVNPFDVFHRPWPPTARGEIMIPHTALTGELLDVDNGLNLRSHWSPAENYFTLSDNRSQLTFVVGQNTAFTRTERFTGATVFRMREQDVDLFYLPLALVSQVFGYTFEGITETEWGSMVRIRQRGLFNDELFLRTRGPTFVRAQFEIFRDRTRPSQQSPAAPPWQQEQGPNAGIALPDLPGVSPPVPPVGGLPADMPAELELFDVPLYLTFDGPITDDTANILSMLEREALPAIFFIQPEDLSKHPEIIRRITARHQIGISITGEANPAALEEANSLLREAAFIKTWLVRSDNASPENTSYRFWGYSHRFTEDATSSRIVRELAPLLAQTNEPEALVLALPHTSSAASAILEILNTIERDSIWRVNPGEIPIR